MTSSPRGWLPAYLVLALIWGGSFYFIKLGLLALTPAGVALSRLALGLVTMLVISAVTRTALPSRRSWVPLFVAAALMTSVPWLLFAFGEERISSALAGSINGATPLMTLVAILLVFPEERPTRQRVVGLVVGFAGVLVVMGVWQGLGVGTWLGIGMANLAAAFDPGIFVVGGGVSAAGELLIEPARQAFRKQLTGRGFRPEARIVRAELGNEAGLIGAADLARQSAIA